MIFFLTLLVTASAFDKDVLRSGLQSTEGQLKLFRNWMVDEHASYSPREQNFRFRVFRKHLKEIVETNDAQDQFELDANFMAALTEEEQKQWHGINITARPAEILVDDSPILTMPASGSKLWREEGKVTPVQNQGGCGSCWAFAGIASFEGHYAIKTGGLKRFSEQQFVDCTYENENWDGCNGGWYWEAYDNVVKAHQHLALAKDYTYTARDSTCRVSSKPNGMTAASFTRTARPARSGQDSNLVQALQQGPVAMAFEINGGFSYYKTGVLSIRNCGSTPHHAMAVTGYTPEFFEIKNSWGSRWGDQGYVRFDRKITNMCGISNWNAYPVLKKTGDDDDDVTPTDGGDDGDDNADCTDVNSDCAKWTDYCESNGWVDYMQKYCAKTCNYCCPSGTVRCASGECKHEHLC